MEQQLIELTETKNLQKLYNFFTYYEQNGDKVRAEKVKDLLKKEMAGEINIAFCGHFSAGKSTMINTLIGENILPTSPIPTSANLVKIRFGSSYYAKFYMQDGKVLYQPAPFDLNKIKGLFKDGELIKSVEIEVPSDSLPKGAVIMDTPGIDSTDQAHKLATESAMYLADAVFYVMDYNHVQAEENFLFTKEMQNFGKEVYLIVNMIDKHQEQELPMEKFQQSVLEAFAAWSIKPKGIFYTSLKDFDHPYNNFNGLKQQLFQIFSNKQRNYVPASLKLLMEEHLQSIEEDQQEEVDQLNRNVQHLSEQQREQVYNEFEKITKEINERTNIVSIFEKEKEEELENILKNAYLMPAETRELAKQYLESLQKDFKVGFLFTKKKTEEKRRDILLRFKNDLQENTNTQIVWHVKTCVLKFMKKYKIFDHTLENKIQTIEINVTEDMIAKSVKQGALVTGESVLNYTNDVANQIKSLTRKTIDELFDIIKSHLLEECTDQLTELEKEKRQLQEYIYAINRLKKIKEEYHQVKNYLQQLMDSQLNNFDEVRKQVEKIIENTNEVILDIDTYIHETESVEKSEQTNKDKRKNRIHNIQDNHSRYNQTIKKLKNSVPIFANTPTLEKLAVMLKERVKRLENQQFTVALFGAFSAGKSSFANALMGEKILPVSPNPTTASINRILPANKEHPHETGVVKLKSEQMLLDDLNVALQYFNHQADSLEEVFRFVMKISEDDVKEQNKTHLSFLKAFEKGYHNFENQLGQEITVTKKEFQQFVAEEDKSCFVEWINFYYDSSVTEKGITLVDTPGADSINARHTDVSFEYIKNADAIIFVTYYNHAFSKADREFLIQLGRVKDQFTLDKMFFIVNAVDLANDEDELKDVLNYIENQLLQFGIRHANLYPVSSLNALKEKQMQEQLHSYFPEFENSFYQFITSDLKEIAISAAETEWKHAVERVRVLVESASSDIEEKEQKLKRLQVEKSKIQSILNDLSLDVIKEQINQELAELIYYINQRNGLRFNDFFKESFNPATIKGANSEAKQSLQFACKELLTSIGFDLSQELRATTLRIENFVHKQLASLHESLVSQIKKINENLSFTLFENNRRLETPNFENELINLSTDYFAKELGIFKNTKAFFEKNERKQMAEAIQERLKEPIAAYLEKGEKTLQSRIEVMLFESVEHLISKIQEELNEQFNGWISVLENKIDIDLIKRNLTVLEEL
jgi:predicted GTPase